MFLFSADSELFLPFSTATPNNLDTWEAMLHFLFAVEGLILEIDNHSKTMLHYSHL